MKVSMPLEMLAKLPQSCAWKGCTATCDPLPTPLPPGWVCLVTFRETAQIGVLDFIRDKTSRDTSLCAEHSAALEACLKAIK